MHLIHGSHVGFDTRRYLRHQSRAIKSVLKKSHDKLYIEFGGKLLQDKHCARVLPGYHEDAKLNLLKKFRKRGECIFVISSKDIVRKRIRGDFGTPYDLESIRIITELKNRAVPIRHVAVSLLKIGKPIPPSVQRFARRLQALKIKVYFFYEIPTYSPKRLLAKHLEINPFIKIRKEFVFIISPGGGSGKFGICLNQLYYEMKHGKSPRYLKFETFPIHDLSVDHPLNLAYMAASADFYDVVMKDRRHGTATSYKRDLENYEMLSHVARNFKSHGKYLRRLSSATNMGINMLSKGIVNDELVEKEAAAEIARRLIRYKFEVAKGKERKETLARVRKILSLL